MKKDRSWSRIWLSLGLALLILLFLVYLVDWEMVLVIYQLTDWRLIFWGSLALIPGYILISIRYRKILANKPGLLRTFHSDSIGYMVTMFTPVPAPALRVVTLNQITTLTFQFISSGMVVETLLGVVMRILAFIGVILLTTKITESFGSIVISVGVIVLTFVGIIWFVNHVEMVVKKLGEWVSKFPFLGADRVDQIMTDFQTGIKEVGSNRTLLIGMTNSLLMWSLFTVFLYLAWVALPVEVTPRQMLTLAVASLIFVPPSAPAMIGVYQGVLVGSLLLLRITDVTALTAYSILIFTIQLFFWLIMGVWALFRTDLRLRELINQTSGFLQETGQEETLEQADRSGDD